MAGVTRSLLAALVAIVVACGGGTPDAAGNGEPDAPGVCVLPDEIIQCTAGDNAPCMAECDAAFCRNFNHTGDVCTTPCEGATSCPDTWSCNRMGFCRPPG